MSMGNSDELTNREKQTANYAVQGMSNRQIAQEMRLQESTVKQYLHRVYDKVGVGGRGQLAQQLTESRK